MFRSVLLHINDGTEDAKRFSKKTFLVSKLRSSKNINDTLTGRVMKWLIRLTSFQTTFISVLVKKIYRQIVGIPMGTNCAPLIADLFLYCYESQFMAKLHKDSTKSDLIEKFNNTHRYLDDIFALNNSDFFMYTSDIYP